MPVESEFQSKFINCMRGFGIDSWDLFLIIVRSLQLHI